MTWTYLTATIAYLAIAIAANFTPRVGRARLWAYRILIALALVCLVATWFMDIAYAWVLAIADVVLLAATVWAERLATGNLRRRRQRLQS